MSRSPQTGTPAPGRNDPCPCGSGRKYKHCCAASDRAAGFQDEFVQAHFRRGAALQARGLIDQAIQAYRTAVACGASPEAHRRLGHILLDRGLIMPAIEAFRAAAASPSSAERRLDLAMALILEGKNAEAEAELREVIDLTTGNADAFWLLGRILSEGGRFEDAWEALERAVMLEPGHGAAYYDLVRCRRLGSADRALIARMQKAV